LEYKNDRAQNLNNEIHQGQILLVNCCMGREIIKQYVIKHCL
jgi:hypothetical protein